MRIRHSSGLFGMSSLSDIQQNRTVLNIGAKPGTGLRTPDPEAIASK
jgi:hypothetical protein